MSYEIGSLFSGIGGLELGLEWAGLGPVLWQVERDPFCRDVLARRWPNTQRFDDVRTVGAELPRVGILCGGFPCTDISDASRGRGEGIDGEESGLWSELVRVVDTITPRWIVVENVDGAAWRKWVPLLRSELHGRGYASLPIRVRACDVGAPMRGSRIFLVATPDREGESARALHAQVARLPEIARACWRDWGSPPPRALGVADGPSRGVDGCRRGAAGRAVVPACARVVGEVIRALEAIA